MTNYLESVYVVLFSSNPAIQVGLDGVSPRELAEVTSVEAFKEADVNGDNQLSFEEFEAWYKSEKEAKNVAPPCPPPIRSMSIPEEDLFVDEDDIVGDKEGDVSLEGSDKMDSLKEHVQDKKDGLNDNIHTLPDEVMDSSILPPPSSRNISSVDDIPPPRTSPPPITSHPIEVDHASPSSSFQEDTSTVMENRQNSVPPPPLVENRQNSVPPPPLVENRRNSVPPPPLVENRQNSVPPPPLVENRQNSVPPPPLVENRQNSVPPPPLVENRRNSVPPPPLAESRRNSVPPPPLAESRRNSVPPPTYDFEEDSSFSDEQTSTADITLPNGEVIRVRIDPDENPQEIALLIQKEFDLSEKDTLRLQRALEVELFDDE